MLPLLFALLLSFQLVAAGDAAPFARQPSVATSKGLSQLSVRNPKFSPREYVCPVNYYDCPNHPAICAPNGGTCCNDVSACASGSYCCNDSEGDCCPNGSYCTADYTCTIYY